MTSSLSTGFFGKTDDRRSLKPFSSARGGTNLVSGVTFTNYWLAFAHCDPTVLQHTSWSLMIKMTSSLLTWINEAKLTFPCGKHGAWWLHAFCFHTQLSRIYCTVAMRSVIDEMEILSSNIYYCIINIIACSDCTSASGVVY